MRILPISVVVVLGLVLLPVPATEVASASAASPIPAIATASAPIAIRDAVALGKLRTLLEDPRAAAPLSFRAPDSAAGLLGNS